MVFVKFNCVYGSNIGFFIYTFQTIGSREFAAARGQIEKYQRDLW